jgi:hypothetical protein
MVGERLDVARRDLAGAHHRDTQRAVAHRPTSGWALIGQPCFWFWSFFEN